MENLVKKYEGQIEFSKNLITEKDLELCEKEMEVVFGAKLKEYVLDYGYLAKDDVEFYGINSKQLLNSDMVKNTISLHKEFEETKDKVLFASFIDSIYYLVDKDDMVFKFDAVEKTLSKTEDNIVTFIDNTFSNT